MTQEPKLLTEAKWHEMLESPASDIEKNLAELRKRGLIAPEPVSSLSAAERAVHDCFERWKWGFAPFQVSEVAQAVLATVERPTRKQEREALLRAFHAVRGTNADMCRGPSRAYQLCCEAVKRLYDQASTGDA